MGVVLPGKADPAVDLDVHLRVVHRRPERQMRRHGRRQVELVGRVGRARAASHTAAVASSPATSMSAQWCLTASNVPMGRPNCTRSLA